jgi:hypothetical protein
MFASGVSSGRRHVPESRALIESDYVVRMNLTRTARVLRACRNCGKFQTSNEFNSPSRPEARSSGSSRMETPQTERQPGNTCLRQVDGRGRFHFEDWVTLDLRYIDNWSLWISRFC